MVLMHVVQARHEHGVRLPLLPLRDEELEDVLARRREGADLEAVHDQILLRDADRLGGLAYFALEGVGRKALRERLRGDGKREVPHLGPALDEPRHGPTAAELTVVGVGGKNERAFPALDHAVASSPPWPAASAASARSPHVIGSSKSAS